jgi:DNA-directed RNA polymerase subunit beta
MEFGISLKSTSTSSEYESYSEALSAHLFTQRSYELGGAGRYKMNRKFPLTERLLGRIIAQDIVDVNGKVIFSRGQLLNKPEIDVLKDAFSNNKLDLNHKFSFTTNKFTKGHNNTLEQIDIYENNFNQNSIVKICAPGKKSDEPILNISDILTIISYTLGLKFEILKYDNIEHIGNKRLRLIHEQLCYKLASGLSAVVKVARDKLMSLVAKTADAKNKAKLREKATLKSIIVPRKFLSSVQSFFNTYSLTQFLDQVNPLSELSAKRKITAMGEGGIDQDDPDLTIRDIHYSQFGRICPIESPEGLSVGLIMSLAAYTKIDDNGFLISPYYKIINGVITNEVE